MTASDPIKIRSKTTVSAPGKVLVTGGYLVLDRENTGLVIATDARFYASVTTTIGRPIVRVLSPQFEKSSREYCIKVNDEKILLNQTGGEDMAPNKFIETSLEYVMTLVRMLSPATFDAILSSYLEIAINADNDFYSQSDELRRRGLDLTRSSLKQLPKFCVTGTLLQDVHKTGLGSSAALVTSLVASLLIHFTIVSSSLTTDEKNLIHNLAQFCHCLAQGKIGSGFDVSSAVFGSQSYRRFSPDIIEPFLSNPQRFTDTDVAYFKKPWDAEVTSFCLPDGMQMILADVNGGSNSPKMASTVIKWKKDSPEEASYYWKELGYNNLKVEQLMRELSTQASLNPDNYQKAIKLFAALPVKEAVQVDDKNEIYSILVQVHATFENIRKLFRELSEKTQVPIEPPSQTRLLDATLDIPGTLIAGVPGAGGYDAIFCIVLNAEAAKAVDALWNSWREPEMIVCPLLASESSGGVGLICVE